MKTMFTQTHRNRTIETSVKGRTCRVYSIQAKIVKFDTVEEAQEFLEQHLDKNQKAGYRLAS